MDKWGKVMRESRYALPLSRRSSMRTLSLLYTGRILEKPADLPVEATKLSSSST
jgi:hypothetical protein